MISVCIATYNGEKYIYKQIESIINQLSDEDEIVISDDYSTDETIDIIRRFNDSRIKIYFNPESVKKKITKHHKVTRNFENALKHAAGDYIFLSDQDDIWQSNKISVMKEYLKKYALVMCDCTIIGSNEEIIYQSFFELKKSKPGIWRNLIQSRYHGCCIALKKDLLKKALPFPKELVMHDAWLGLISECFYQPKFINDKLVLYRIHNDNVSSILCQSPNSLYFKLTYRAYIAIHLLIRYVKLSKFDD